MTIRTYLAGQALAGLCARGFPADVQAEMAVEYADALLVELAKEKTE